MIKNNSPIIQRLIPQLILALAANSVWAAPKSNVILILADDLGYEGLGCYGSASYETPNLDRLAATGMRFNHCYSQPICTPSRVQLMTGKYNDRNYEGFGYLNPREKTFGNLLKAAGYATCIVGKWQLNGMDNREPTDRRAGWDDLSRPHSFGFDEYLLWQLTRGRAEGERYADPLLVQNGVELPRSPGAYGPDLFGDFIIDFIDRKKDQPFFVYFPMALPHEPFVPTPADPEWADAGGRYDESVKLFASMVGYMDRIVGRIAAKLDEEGLRENTLIIFTGDNGTHFTVTSLMTDGRSIQGGKGLMTDGGTRVPMICNWPGTIAPGAVVDDLVDFSDFLPSLVEVAGATIPCDTTIDGQSFIPLIKGEPYTPRGWIYSHYWGDRGRSREGTQEFVRDQRWKLYADGRLHDISRDPLEESPIPSAAAGSTEARSRLEEVFGSIRNRRGSAWTSAPMAPAGGSFPR